MDKTVVKEHIVLAAAKSFAQKGVKTVRMDDIAAGLSISKRTLYELFHDKEDLLLDVMKLHREGDAGIYDSSGFQSRECFGSPLEVFSKKCPGFSEYKQEIL